MKNMKFFKAFVAGLLASTIVMMPLYVKAASASVTIGSGVMTNIPTVLNGSLKITSVLVSTAGTNFSTNFQFVDTSTNLTFYTNAPFTNIVSYLTNYISTWTNYYGATNSVTNISLIDVTNAVTSGLTNNYPVRLISTIGSNNASLNINPFNQYFVNGCWVTNVGPGAINVTVTYQQ